nr:MAG TPA: RRN7 Zinc-finger of RNA-polymerase I-specific TFIIB, Rrn7 [Caudoviricetes sp.]
MMKPKDDCPYCRDAVPHRRAPVQCTVCGRAFAAYHVPAENNGVRECSDCRQKRLAGTLF